MTPFSDQGPPSGQHPTLNELERLAQGFSGDMAVAAVNLTTGERLQHNGTQVLPTASVIKVPILVTLMRLVEAGSVNLGTRLQLTAEQQVGGSGVLKDLDPGLSLTLRDAATLMISVSDNTATNLVLDSIGDLELVNAAMAELSLPSIRLHNRIDFQEIEGQARRLGEATAEDLCELGRLIAVGECFNRSISVSVEHMMSRQQYLDQGVRYLQVNPYAAELGVTSPVVVASKTGFFPGTRADLGIVRFPAGGGFVYCVMSHDSNDQTFLPEAEGAVVSGLAGRALLESWWPSANGQPPLASTAYADPADVQERTGDQAVAGR